MFNVEELTGEVSLSQGDTGSFEVEAQRDDGEAFTDEDRATFCVMNGDDVLMERVYRLDNPEEDETLGNGIIRIELTNADTRALPVGNYTWEMRYAIGAYTVNGRVVSGDGVDTPGVHGDGEAMPFNVKGVQYKIAGT